MALPNCANLKTKISSNCFASCHGRLAGFWIGRVHRAGVRVVELPALSYDYPDFTHSTLILVFSHGFSRVSS